MSAPRIIIRHIAFTGPNVEEARLDLGPGLNIVYGASNTGKSFTAKALAFMLAGTAKLPQTDEVKPFTAAWLGVTLPDGRDVTLYRATQGGDFRLFDGLVSTEAGTPTALLGSADANKQDTVSHVLLDSMGLSGKVIVKNGNAEKDNLAIRHVLPYVIVSETDIMSEAKAPSTACAQEDLQTFQSPHPPPVRGLFLLDCRHANANRHHLASVTVEPAEGLISATPGAKPWGRGKRLALPRMPPEHLPCVHAPAIRAAHHRSCPFYPKIPSPSGMNAAACGDGGAAGAAMRGAGRRP